MGKIIGEQTNTIAYFGLMLSLFWNRLGGLLIMGKTELVVAVAVIFDQVQCFTAPTTIKT